MASPLTTTDCIAGAFAFEGISTVNLAFLMFKESSASSADSLLRFLRMFESCCVGAWLLVPGGSRTLFRAEERVVRPSIFLDDRRDREAIDSLGVTAHICFRDLMDLWCSWMKCGCCPFLRSCAGPIQAMFRYAKLQPSLL